MPSMSPRRQGASPERGAAPASRKKAPRRATGAAAENVLKLAAAAQAARGACAAAEGLPSEPPAAADSAASAAAATKGDDDNLWGQADFPSLSGGFGGRSKTPRRGPANGASASPGPRQGRWADGAQAVHRQLPCMQEGQVFKSSQSQPNLGFVPQSCMQDGRAFQTERSLLRTNSNGPQQNRPRQNSNGPRQNGPRQEHNPNAPRQHSQPQSEFPATPPGVFPTAPRATSTPARRFSAPARPTSVPAFRSEPMLGPELTQAAQLQLKSLMDQMMLIAQHQVQQAAAGPQPALASSFLEVHAKTTKLMKELQINGPDGTPAPDPAALLAFNLTVAAVSNERALRVKDHVEKVWAQESALASIAENAHLRPRRNSVPSHSPSRHGRCMPLSPGFIPTPCHSGPQLVPVLVAPMPGGPGALPGWALPVVPSATQNSHWHSLDWASSGPRKGPREGPMGTPAAQLRRQSMDKKRQRRKSQYSVVNPRTGESLVITSVVPFSWRRTRRLRIMDPKTGEEVMPSKTEEEGEDGDGHSAAGVAARASIGTDSRTSIMSPRPSMTSRPSMSPSPDSRCGRHSVTPAKRERHMSIAGGAVKDGCSWFLEPAGGGYWDWPLSRQEKKERVLLFSQLELLSEIEELQAGNSMLKMD